MTTLAPQAAEPTKVCLGCGDTFPYDQLAKDRKSQGGVSGRCLPCDNARKRRSERGVDEDLGHLAVDKAPDRRPAERLRLSLTRSRAAGVEWDAAWKKAIGFALGAEAMPSWRQDEWQAAFTWARPHWRAAYLRQPFDTCALFLADD